MHQSSPVPTNQGGPRRPTRVRFTMRQMMVGVGVAAVGLGGVIEGPRHYWRCRGTSSSCRRIGSHLAIDMVRDRVDDPVFREKMGRLVAWYDYMAQRYERALWQPWILLWPDPPKPE
jgi:hypothetical protein